MIDAGILRAIMPRADAGWVDPLNNAMVEFQIFQSTARIAMFLAQLAHESGELRYVREIWGPTKYQLKYEGNKALGNIEPDDGKKFLGRGPIQVTGRANTAACSRALYGDLRLLDTPELLEQRPDGSRAAGWYWQSRGLNALADAGEFEAVTHRINPAELGEPQREAYWSKAKIALGLT